MRNFTIRRAQKKDLPSLGRLGARLVRMHHAFDHMRFKAPGNAIEEGYSWFLGEQMKESTVAVFVAEQDRSVAGYVYAALEPLNWKELRDPAGFIHDVVVDEPKRDSGMGAALVEAASDWIREKGVPRVILWTAEQNTGAQRLFARLGFRRTMIEMTRELVEKP